jgi:CheY-like chemotaxis protein
VQHGPGTMPHGGDKMRAQTMNLPDARRAHDAGRPICLVVDDNQFDRRLIRNLLRRAEAAVDIVEAGSLAEARARLAAGRPDMILLDQRLPDGSGLSFARELSVADGTIPVVLITSAAEPDLAAAARAAGCVTLVAKDDLSPKTLGALVGPGLRQTRPAPAVPAAPAPADPFDRWVADFARQVFLRDRLDSLPEPLARAARLLRSVQDEAGRGNPALHDTLDQIARLVDGTYRIAVELSATRGDPF